MAKSARSSTRKANNQRLKSKVFGPVEAARAERLSAKLTEIVSQPKPEASEMKIVVDDADEEVAAAVAKVDGDATVAGVSDTAMEVDTGKSTSAIKRSDKKRIEKRRKTSKIVFPKYGDKNKTKKR
ncbi:uncharacterized protein GGS25DRAFT_518790 [Hypoxylon fragiforme]|uniref:uncharacterized protein n=1 Tax=Hypoxylon fragiforme TaxID=63214 RepID=UPI0020C7020A|nr:uncharacterized protein GGS25DRAFT_518790 [Hypoxylon fragiforme]KAI2613108.1 hypothetical protein GGS25DRAFT_518790 [Hypoxylon fragiforme]